MSDPETRALDAENQAAFAGIRKAREEARLAQEEAEARQRESDARTAQEFAEQRRRETAERREAEIRARFFAGNPGASESDFLRLAPHLRDQAMMQAAAEEPNTYEKIRAEMAERQRSRESVSARLDRFTVGAEEAA